MMQLEAPLRPFHPRDADRVAQLHLIASGGLAEKFWRDSVGAEGDVDEFARQRQLSRVDAGETVVVADDGNGAEAVMIADALPVDPVSLDAMPTEMRPMGELENLVPGSWNLLFFATLPDCRRRGHGRRLMDAFVHLGREKGHRLASIIVFDPNPPAQACYAAHGFQEIARRDVVREGKTTDFWADHWILMTRAIRQSPPSCQC